MGIGIQPEEDKMTIKADTFHLFSESFIVGKMYNRADSLLLGTFVDEKYGTIHADILARVEAPFDSTGFRFPTDMNNLKADSAFLILSYSSWFGSEYSTMSVKAYELNKGNVLDYYEYYPTDIDPSDYFDSSNPILLGDTIFAANDSANIRIRLRNDANNNYFINRLFENSKEFTSETDFFNRFNGLYIESNIGDATMMYLRSIGIVLHYSYETEVAGNTTTFSNTVNYMVNNTIVNRFQHPDTAKIATQLQQQDSINYIASPANIYTQINVPLKKMIESMQGSIGTDKRLIVNSALIKVEAKETDNKTTASNIALPLPGNMLLMKKEDMNAFFTQERSTSDSIIYASYNSADSCYLFNMATYIDREIRRSPIDENGKIQISDDLETLEMVLVPVRVVTSSDAYGNRTVVSVKQQVLMSGVAIRSGSHPDRPMKVNLLYSGY